MAGRPFESCTPSQIRTIQHFFFDTFPSAGDSLAVDSVDTLLVSLRVMAAMLQMNKLDIKGLQQAADGA